MENTFISFKSESHVTTYTWPKNHIKLRKTERLDGTSIYSVEDAFDHGYVIDISEKEYNRLLEILIR